MDDEVTQIFKKWKLNNPLPHPKKDGENLNTLNQNETFDSRTFTRPSKRRTFNINNSNYPSSSLGTATESDAQSIESGVSIFLLNALKIIH